jgi:nitrogen regulatory protein P-II 1
MLRKIEAYLTPSNLEPLRDFLLNKGVEGMSVIDAQGIGVRSKKDKKGKPQLEKRIKVEIVVGEDRVEDIVAGIKDLAAGASIGAGMVFIVPVEDAVRLSTREVGKSAIL